jgi:hypothetical protein
VLKVLLLFKLGVLLEDSIKLGVLLDDTTKPINFLQDSSLISNESKKDCIFCGVEKSVVQREVSLHEESVKSNK